ncbi:MAG TPA: hypothetical protein VEF76_14185 [Patescibacteria group bacterium]|nr:hypothetical protein [Patescibacteria group bacterium]
MKTKSKIKTKITGPLSKTGGLLSLIPAGEAWLRRRREEQFETFLYVIATRAWLSSCYAGKDSHARR